MDSLQGMLKRRSVMLREHVWPDFDLVLGRDTNDERIERTMVDCTHRYPVWDDRFAALRILPDVGCIQ